MPDDDGDGAEHICLMNCCIVSISLAGGIVTFTGSPKLLTSEVRVDRADVRNG